MKNFISKEKPKNIEITAEKRIVSATKTSESRIKLYTRGLKRLSDQIGYTLRTMSSSVDTKFFMHKNNLTENFGNSDGNLSPLSYQGDAAWRNEKDFFKKWFSLPYMTNGYADQNVSEDAELTVTDEMIKEKIKKVLKKYNITFAELKPILAKGQKTEFEHTDNAQIARNIALDHIEEFLDYYDRLEKVEEDTTRTTKKGGVGTLKAKITKKYGGNVTCDKAKKLKSRKNATPHDKSQANWFLNMNCKEEKLIEDGRIVKGVNTTIDVGTDETKIQAKKFGNIVDKDGKPIYSFSDSVKMAGNVK